MDIFLINNDFNRLEAWRVSALSAYPDAQMHLFDDPMLAIRECVKLPPERVFAACTMRPMDGFAVLRMLRRRYPNIAVCLVGDTDKDRYDASNIHADGYIDADITTGEAKAFESAYLKMLAGADA